MKSRVALVSPSYNNYGGGQIYLSSIYAEMKALGCNVDILAADDVFSENIQIKRLDTWFNKSKNIFSLIFLLKKNKYDSVILNDINISMFSLLFKSFGIRVFPLIHMELTHVHSIRNSLLKTILIKVRTLSISSGSELIFSVNKTNDKLFKPSKTLFIGNLLPKIDDYNQIKGLEKIYDYIYIGRLDTEKNLFSLLDYFLYCKTINPNFKAIVVGDGPLKKALDDYNLKLGLNEYVIFHGFAKRNEIETLFKRSKCNILYSITEGFPTTILEAAFYDVPSIVSNVGSCEFIAKSFPHVVDSFSFEESHEEVFMKSKALIDRYSFEQKGELLEKYSSINVSKEILSRLK
ncbi:glycosyltransferase [Vibrio splendidus]|uniref:glycosyltransferase n=1 Tax=Vibrio splendidus TaxID=29497 RepID=UPI000C837BB7|nr:glycosyltransferase [Vibrio splendidus]PMO94714.1 hypothetical protein BCS97_16675 [Vibrio splendidus]PMP20144.1 hypothetical protein BCS89_03950 [Vibrio splendidus]PMP36843.1 hypothetical protein BCS88_05515 [Vibrio splendidus]PMP41710.1 hypothetical protein BCS87_05625 [Vibrio splendidus]PMP45725.1 hypothetical protein BCS85_16810 [Vibrio splendidus]